MNSLIDAESNHLTRRCFAFAVDVIFAACLATLIPSTIAEVSGGRYQLTDGPGFRFTLCYPSSEHAKSTAAIIDQIVRSAPANTGQPEIENCVAVLNLIVRSTFVQVGFPPADQHGGSRLVRVATDFNGEPGPIIPLEGYVPLFEAVFLLVFLAGAWVGSTGMRLMGIRVRSLSGEKPGVAAFIARYGVLILAFAPLLLPFGDIITRLILVSATGAVLVLPWYKGSSLKIRGLHDVLAGTVVVRFV